MEIKNNTKILKITHDDLVNLFCTALEGNNWVSCEYDKEFYNSLKVGQVEGDCDEDHIADVLLNGGNIYLFDEYAEGEIYGKKGEVIEGDGDGTVMYTITLEDVIQGLENAFNGSIKSSDFNDSGMKSWVRECVEELADEECCDLDLPMADALLQIIMFNEVIYG